VSFDWDLPLLDGYRHRFLRNVASDPSANGYAGLDTPEIGGILAQERFDAVLVCGWYHKAAWQTIRAARKIGTPLMALSDSNLLSPGGSLKSLLKMPVYRWLISRFDACLAAGSLSRAYFLHFGAPENRIFLVPHSVAPEHFGARADDLQGRRDEFRRFWNLDPLATVFAFAGKFTAKKRPVDFIEAIAAAAAIDPSIQGLMVGDGPLFDLCRDRVAREGLPVQFAGFLNQSRIPEAYIASDMLVVPSGYGETWGLVANEAMSCGRPCIVSDLTGCAPDLIVSGETGFVFPAFDPAALAKTMLAAAADREGIDHMGRAAARLISRYSPDAAVAGVVEALRAIGGGK
jgi:glycosyltransferase involved in cell wall biosynthesis